MRAAKIMAAIAITALLGGCATGEKQADLKKITYFSYHHAGSAMDDAQSYAFSVGEDGVRFNAQWNGGTESLDVAVDEDVIERLEEIVSSYNMHKWDGFDKTSKHASDGDVFSLKVTFEDGTEISACGSNAFPKGYGEAKKAFLGVCLEQAELYADQVVKEDLSETDGE